MAKTRETSISFVIPAHDEESLIGSTLDSLLAAAWEAGWPFEIIVAADGCSDRTAEIARSRGARVVVVGHRQIAATRNSGAARATGDVLIFVDADTQVSVAPIRAGVRAIEAGAVYSGVRTRFGGAPFVVRCLLHTLVRFLQACGVATGCFFVCRREDFVAAGGFDENRYAGEEVWLSFALRKRGRFAGLKEHVVTSSRKIRTHSAREILTALFLPLWKGRRAYREREDLDVWYGPRRTDPNPERDFDGRRAA